MPLTANEFAALVTVLNRAPMTPPEILAIQMIMTKLDPASQPDVNQNNGG